MVTNSQEGYNNWRKGILELYTEKFSESKALKFVSFIDSRYKSIGKNFLPHKLMWKLVDHYYKVTKKNQQQAYGCFGRGGYGKSTLLKNVLWFLDPTFNQTRIAQSEADFERILFEVSKLPNRGRYKAVMIDEPSPEEHHQSKEWKMTQSVLNQMRQANLFVGICATDMSLVKTSFYSLITGTFAFRKMFVYDYYDEDKTPQILGDIRKLYDPSYKVFNLGCVLKRRYVKNMKSSPFTPIDVEIKDYEEQKHNHFMDTLKRAVEMKEKKFAVDVKESMSDEDKIILRMRKLNKSQLEIGNAIGVSQNTICLRLKKLKKIENAINQVMSS